MADLACTAHITMWTSPDRLDGLAFGRTMDRLYSLILDQSRPPRPIVGPLGTLTVTAGAPSLCSRARSSSPNRSSNKPPNNNVTRAAHPPVANQAGSKGGPSKQWPSPFSSPVSRPKATPHPRSNPIRLESQTPQPHTTDHRPHLTTIRHRTPQLPMWWNPTVVPPPAMDRHVVTMAAVAGSGQDRDRAADLRQKEREPAERERKREGKPGSEEARLEKGVAPTDPPFKARNHRTQHPSAFLKRILNPVRPPLPHPRPLSFPLLLSPKPA